MEHTPRYKDTTAHKLQMYIFGILFIIGRLFIATGAALLAYYIVITVQPEQAKKSMPPWAAWMSITAATGYCLVQYYFFYLILRMLGVVKDKRTKEKTKKKD